MNKSRPHPFFYCIAVLFVLGMATQGDPHHYFPFGNKADKEDKSSSSSEYVPAYQPTYVPSSSGGSAPSLPSSTRSPSTSSTPSSGFGPGSGGTSSKNYDTYRKNKYGFEERTGSIREVSPDRKEVYEKNKYGFEEKVGSMRKNHSGGYDVYRKNKYGFEEKVGSVE